MDEALWSTLIDRIESGRCTPFIGAGACYGILPTGSELSRAIADPGYPFADRENLPRVAQHRAVVVDNLAPKEAVATFLKQRLPQSGALPAGEHQIHRVLAKLPVPVYLTTNYDNLMTHALAETPRKARREVCRWNDLLASEADSAFDSGYRPTKEEPVVFHLHGVLEDPQSMVLTEDDYLDFLVNSARELGAKDASNARSAGMLPLPIVRAIRDSTLLFIGYSLSDINFRVILRGLVGSLARGQQRKSVTVQLAPTDQNSADVRQYLERYFDSTLKLAVHWGDADSFAAELGRRGSWGRP